MKTLKKITTAALILFVLSLFFGPVGSAEAAPRSNFDATEYGKKPKPTPTPQPGDDGDPRPRPKPGPQDP
jgi:hypothetical protein